MREPTIGQKLYPAYDPWHEGDEGYDQRDHDWMMAAASNEPVGVLVSFRFDLRNGVLYSPGESLEEYRARQRGMNH